MLQVRLLRFLYLKNYYLSSVENFDDAKMKSIF